MPLTSFAYFISLLRKDFLSYSSTALTQRDITFSQLFILIYAHKKEGATPKEISEYLHLDQGQLNRTLARLIEKNLIDMRKSEKDRRVNHLYLTKEGKEVVQESRKLFYSWDDKILSPLEDGEKEALIKTLSKLVEKLNIGEIEKCRI